MFGFCPAGSTSKVGLTFFLDFPGRLLATLPFMKTLFFTFLAIPLCLTAQTDETKLKQVVGFENQIGIQIGPLSFHGYTERSIGRAWTYRVDLGYDMQIQSLEQAGETGMLSASPATSAELRHYWPVKKESASLFVSLKAGRIWTDGSDSEGSEDLSIQQNSMKTSLFVGRNKNIGLLGRLEIGGGVDVNHASGNYFKAVLVPTVHARIGLGW